MTLHDVRMFSDYAKKNLTLRQLALGIASALGVEFQPVPEKPKPSDYMTAEQLAMLVKMTGGRIEGMGNG